MLCHQSLGVISECSIALGIWTCPFMVTTDSQFQIDANSRLKKFWIIELH